MPPAPLAPPLPCRPPDGLAPPWPLAPPSLRAPPVAVEGALLDEHALPRIASAATIDRNRRVNGMNVPLRLKVRARRRNADSELLRAQLQQGRAPIAVPRPRLCRTHFRREIWVGLIGTDKAGRAPGAVTAPCRPWQRERGCRRARDDIANENLALPSPDRVAPPLLVLLINRGDPQWQRTPRAANRTPSQA